MSAPARAAKTETSGAHVLKKRVEYFLGSKVLGRDEVARFSCDLARLGQTAIVGGMLRDLYLIGNWEFFRSDVDFVVHDCSQREFDRWMLSLNGRKNRFGGYQVKLDRWKVEAWLLESTWAREQGLREVQNVRDILFTTFFDWDAILYDVHSRELIVDEGYFSRVSQRLLDIRLKENPNPAGNAVRALRYALRWEASLGPRLAEHVLREIVDNGWERLLEIEQRSFGQQQLQLLDLDEVEASLRLFVSKTSASERDRIRIEPRARQLTFDFV